MRIILNVNRVMVGLLEMAAIVIKANGLHILASMQRLGNMCYFIIPEADMVIGSLEISALNFKKTQAQSSLRFKFPIDCFRATRPSQ